MSTTQICYGETSVLFIESIAAENFQGIVGENIGPLRVADRQVLDDYFCARHQGQQRRWVCAEKELFGADGLVGTHDRGRMVGDRIHMKRLEIFTRSFGDQHWLVGSQAGSQVAQFISVIHAADNIADASAEMTADEFKLGKSFEDAAHDQAR